MSEQETYAAWFRELRMLENRLQELLQSYESHATQAIA